MRGVLIVLEIENRILINRYDQQKFPFEEIFSDHCGAIFGTTEVEKLHQYIPDDLKPGRILQVGEDQATYGHNLLYQIDPAYQNKAKVPKKVCDRGFIKLYQQFITFLEANIFGENLVYQKLPTLRIHLPHNLSVGEYHRDRNYNHPLEEINIWVPITKAKGTATIQMESAYKLQDFHPVEAEYGEYVIFDSALMHGNEVNIEDYTRVSFDFRVIPLSKYRGTDSASINQNMKFHIGDYYSFNGSTVPNSIEEKLNSSIFI